MTKKDVININSNPNKSLEISDLTTFNSLFQSNYKLLYNYILKLSNDSDVAKDIVQEAYIKLWEKRHTINPQLSIENYLFKICHNEFLLYLRKRKKEISLLDSLKYEIAYEIYETHHNEDSKRKLFRSILEKLPDRTKEAFILNKYENLKYKEVAIKMGVSVKTVEKHISKALKFLKSNVKSILF